jgi:hypothetical protein
MVTVIPVTEPKIFSLSGGAGTETLPVTLII